MPAVPRATPAARRRRTAARLLLACAATLAACRVAATPPDDATPHTAARDALDVPAAAPGIRGTVTRVVAGDSVAPAPGAGDPSTPVSGPPSCAPTGRPLRAVLVEEAPGEGAGGDKSMVTMLAGARVLRRTASGVEPAGFADLRVGRRVSVWFDGPVAESYPTQARGGVVVIEP